MIIRKKNNITWKRSLSAFLLGVGLAFGIGAVFLLALEENPLLAYQALFFESFKGINKLVATLVELAPLLTVALGLSVVFRCGFWNIGADGQYVAGILIATWIGVRAGGIPSIITLPLMILAGFVAGGLLGLVPTLLKIKRGINEVFTTLILNFITIYIALYLIGSPWRRPGSPYPETDPLAQSAWFPVLIPGTSFHVGVIISFILVFAIYLLIFKSTLGYKIRAVGINPATSKLRGISVGKTLMIAMFISGGLAGIAGAVELGGIFHKTTYETVLLGVGYLSILIAFLGRNHPIWIALASFFYAVLLVGGESMTMVIGVPRTFTMVLQILILLLILVADRVARYEIRLR